MNGNGNPQVENGFIKIASEIAEALMRTQLSGYQIRILCAVWRKTYGWKKKEDSISVSQFAKMTGIAPGHISRTLKELEMRNIITRSASKTKFNKRYSQWEELKCGNRPYRRETH